MARLIWSPEAADDLEEICEYIARDSEHYARVFAGQVIELVKKIAAIVHGARLLPSTENHE